MTSTNTAADNTANASEADAAENDDSDASSAGQVRQAARGSAFNLLGAITAAVISFITVGLITNNFGPVGAGLFFSATALFTLAANGARLGAESSLTFFVSRLRAEDRHGSIAPLTRSALAATGVVSLLLAVAGFVLAPDLAEALADGANVRPLTSMIRVLAFATPAFALSQAMFGASRGFGTMRPAVIVGQLLRPILQFALVALVVLASGQPVGLAVAWGAAAVVTAVPIAAWLRRRLKKIPHAAQPFSSSEYWRFAAPRALTDVLSSALERVDVLLVAYILDQAQAGLYGTANRLIVAGQLMMFATAQSMAPHLSANFVKGRHAQAKQVLQTVSAWNVTLLWPMFIGLAFGAPVVLRLFGQDFTEGAVLVQVFAVSLLVIIGLGVGDTVLLMTGRSMASLVNHAIGLAVMIGLAFLLLPRIGVVGAAWAWAASRILIRLLAVLQVWKLNGVHGLGLPVLIAAVISVVAYGPTGWIAHNSISNGVLAVAVHAAVGGVIQLALCLRFRRQLELDQLSAIIRRRPATYG